MFLKKSFKKDLLLLLARGLDFWNSTLSYEAQRYFLYFGRWRKSTIYSQVSKLLKVGDIEKIIKNGKPYLRLTSQGNEKLQQDIPFLALSDKKWRKKWCLVVFDIPEKRVVLRNFLRRKLVSLGFGKWQRSVYISPYDLTQEVNQFLKHQKLFKYAVCLEAKRLSRGDDRLIAKKAWQLNKLEEKYWQFIDDCYQLEEKVEDKTFKKQDLTAFVNQFLELLRDDPFLPKELLHSHWPILKAKKAFRTILNKTGFLF